MWSSMVNVEWVIQSSVLCCLIVICFILLSAAKHFCFISGKILYLLFPFLLKSACLTINNYWTLFWTIENHCLVKLEWQKRGKVAVYQHYSMYMLQINVFGLRILMYEIPGSIFALNLTIHFKYDSYDWKSFIYFFYFFFTFPRW